jgi:hypothetical protein
MQMHDPTAIDWVVFGILQIVVIVVAPLLAIRILRIAEPGVPLSIRINLALCGLMVVAATLPWIVLGVMS